MRRISFIKLSLLVLYLVFGGGAAAAQTNEFTYQGKLTDAGMPSATYDFEFRLCASEIGDCATTPVLLETKSRPGVSVSNGNFTVKLDFLPTHFTGADRFLEIRVRRLSSDPWTTLNPRQKITSAPYAIKSLNAATADNSLQLGGAAANQFVPTTDARLSDARTPTAGSDNYIQNRTTPQPSPSNFNISGNGTLGGTLSANIVNAATQYNIDGFRILSAPTATANLYAGFAAGNGPGTGTRNSAFGYFAGELTNSGGDNSFFGHFSGRFTVGSRNSFFGTSAGVNTLGGGDNTFIGSNAGLGNTVGSNNTLLGAGANVLSPNLSFATAIGAGATILQSNTIVLGRGAGQDGVFIPGNTFINSNLTVSGTFNANLPAGNGNYIQNNPPLQQPGGFDIGGNGTVGGTLAASVVNAATQFNLGGSRVLSVAGTNNLFAGINAGAAITTGIYNSFFGASAGQANTTGTSNSFFGVGAGLDNTTGNDNSFFGDVAGASNTTGGGNSFVGTNAGRSNTTGGNNSFVGSFAAQSNTTGNNNTLIGAGANVGANNLTFATALGSNAVVHANNMIVLGRENGSDSVTIAGSVGIGTTAPAAKLHVSGTGVIRARINSDFNGGLALALNDQPKWSVATVGNGLFQIYNDSINQNAVSIDGTSNNVGIGANAPTFKLQVVDSGNTGLRVETQTTGGTVASFGGSGAFRIDAPGIVGGRLTILESGNVGIGTALPDQRLSVNGNASKSVGGGAWAVFSDEKLKNINGRFTRGLADLMKLEPIRFEYKPDNALGLRGAGEAIGFSAQEVERILPEAVSRSANGYLQINNDPILWTTLNAVKEQQREIEAQQKTIESQQRQIDALKKFVCESKPAAEICQQEEKQK